MTQTLNDFKVEDAIRWMGGKQKNIEMEGVIVERVRAKARPRRDSPGFAGAKTKKEVSYVVARSKKLFWISVESILLSKKRKAAPARKPQTSKPKPGGGAVQAVLPVAAKKESSAAQEKIAVRSVNTFGGLGSPFVPVPGRPMPLPFRGDFRTLLALLPNRTAGR